MKTSKLLVFLLISSSVSLQAQNPLPNQALDRASGAVDARIKALEERIIALEGQVRVLKSQQAAQAAPTPPATPTPPAAAPAVQVEAAPSAAPLPVYGGSSAASKTSGPSAFDTGRMESGPNDRWLPPATSVPRASEAAAATVVVAGLGL